MAAKKKKTTTKPYGNKTKFVLGLSRDLSAKEVVSEAKKNGITITEAHVYKIRSTAKAKNGKGRATRGGAVNARASKKAATRATGRATKGGRSAKGGRDSSGSSKREFVLSFDASTPASEILRRAKEEGVGLSKAYLYTIRSASGVQAKRAAGAGRGATRTSRTDARSAVKSVRGAAGKLETQFVEAAMDLGLAKATQLLQRLRSRKSY